MPRAKSKNATGLSIHLDNEAPFYTPGSTIGGTVELNTAADTALGEVTVCLYGRAKVHFVQHHGQGESHWRGRAPLFKETIVLYEGKHTHKPGSFSWPFQLTIPKHPDENSLREKKYNWKPKAHYVSTEDYIADHSLPPSLNFRKWGFGYRYHAFIEYVLETSIKEPEGTHLLLPSKSRRSVMPLLLRDNASKGGVVRPLPGIEFSMPPVIREKSADSLTTSEPKYALSSQTTIHIVKTPRLESGDRNEQLTFKQRASSIFNSSRLPSFAFAVTVSTPETIELLDPFGTPFFVKVSPINDERSSISSDAYPPVRASSLSLAIRATTYIRFRGIGTNRHEHSSSEIKLLDRAPLSYDFVTISQNTSTHNTEDVEANKSDNAQSTSLSVAEPTNNKLGVDMTKLSGLPSILTSAKFGRGKLESPLVPTFQSYIISREYELKWRLDLDILGEKVKVESESDKSVTVIDAEIETVKAYLQKLKAESGDAEAEEDEASDTDDDEKDASEGLSKKMTSLLSTKRKTKAEEAAEEQRAAEAQPASTENELPRYEESTSNPLPAHSEGEALPKYET